MPKQATLKTDTITVHIAKDELKSYLIDMAQKEINKGHMPGNFRPALLASDGYGGFKIIFIQVDDKQFKEVEPLDF